MLLPNATFWRMWAVALLLGAIGIAFFANFRPAHAEPMRASFYGAESGHRTASGARFAPMGLTAAHRSLPFGTRLRVCFRGCVEVIINDRGPAAWTGRSLDLAHGAARAIGLESVGVGSVDVEIVGSRAAPLPRHSDRRLRGPRHRRVARHHRFR